MAIWDDVARYIPGARPVSQALQGDWKSAARGVVPGMAEYDIAKDAWQESGAQGWWSDKAAPFLGLKQTDEEKALLAAMQGAAEDYGAYRPQVAQGRMQAMGQTLSMLDPYSRAMESMYGPGAVPDYSQVLQNPLPKGPPGGGQ